jgi:hypothetical protein
MLPNKALQPTSRARRKAESRLPLERSGSAGRSAPIR